MDRYKAKLMARGFIQKYKIDYSEIYIPTFDADILRLLLTFITIEDIEVYQININNVFIESVFRDIIYIYLPEGLKIPKRQILFVVKSLYSLK